MFNYCVMVQRHHPDSTKSRMAAAGLCGCSGPWTPLDTSPSGGGGLVHMPKRKPPQRGNGCIYQNLRSERHIGLSARWKDVERGRGFSELSLMSYVRITSIAVVLWREWLCHVNIRPSAEWREELFSFRSFLAPAFSLLYKCISFLEKSRNFYCRINNPRSHPNGALTANA